MKTHCNKYHRLIISGGGNKCILQLGALYTLGKKRLSKITHFIGVSGGALLACLVSCGAEVEDIINHDQTQPYEFCWSWLLTSPITCFKYGGLVHIDHLRQLFIDWMKAMTAPEC